VCVCEFLVVLLCGLIQKNFDFVDSLWLSGWVWMSDIYVLYVICLDWLCVWVVRECYWVHTFGLGRRFHSYIGCDWGMVLT